MDLRRFKDFFDPSFHAPFGRRSAGLVTTYTARWPRRCNHGLSPRNTTVALSPRGFGRSSFRSGELFQMGRLPGHVCYVAGLARTTASVKRSSVVGEESTLI